ncbi:UDP-N-acetylglucosamine 2-epimerase [Pedobacter polysacchareus]|uniref:UDP-N-acetylglucosamine 2-epimerase n=1 Tax=Pedobacter polysacchareus TaxID=2861973 RepID=UPI001C9913A9|nr:UDP-N-acetylglucosamine 2-epimerase [Pedobacter polysacchareus]
MRIGILTSSRADFGIYLPLLKALKEDGFFKVEIIAFGTHLSNFHGYSLNQIQDAGFNVKYTIDSMPLSDSPDAIASAIGLTTIKFSSFWKMNHHNFDVVFCLGDRYEMFAAVMAGVPFQVQFAHLHGGEKTLGAIDNVFRHCISHASTIHFASTQTYADRLKAMLDEPKQVYNVGAIGLENIGQVKLLTCEEFRDKWGVDLKKTTILTTFHPETVNADKNEYYADELVKVIKANEKFQYLVTMPNADTAGSIIRKVFIQELDSLPNVFLIENLGTQSYFTAMKFCAFLLGNTSSGIIEAASFGKYVINLGARQEGRAIGPNILQASLTQESIQSALSSLEGINEFSGGNIYFKTGSVNQVIKILKELV